MEDIEEQIKLRDEANSIYEELSNGLNGINHIHNNDELRSFIAGSHDIPECIRILENFKQQFKEKLDHHNYMIDKIRTNCTHNWVFIRTTPYHDVYKCSICGQMDFIK